MTTLHHCGLVVSDMERSLSLYRDLLGLPVTRDVGPEGLSHEYVAFLRRELGESDGLPRVVYLEAGGGRIVLVQFSGGRDPAAQQAGARATSHVAFVVDDIHGLYRRMQSTGIRFNSPPLQVPEGPLAGGFSVHFTDPDGHRVELIQLPAQRAATMHTGGEAY